MTATLTSGQTVDYDKVKKIEETHPNRPDVKVAMYIFTRGNIGAVHVCPVSDVVDLGG